MSGGKITVLTEIRRARPTWRRWPVRPSRPEPTDLANPGDQTGPPGPSSRTGYRQWPGWRAVLARVVPVVAVLALSGGMWFVHWHDPGRHATGDTLWYAKAAFGNLGEGPLQAQQDASRVVCAHQPVADRALCEQSYQEFWYAPRYERIFTSRPVYPLVITLFLALFGGGGMVVATCVIGMLAGLLVYLAVRDLGGSALAGIAGAAVLFLLPSGHWLAMLLAEGTMLVGLLATLVGVIRVCQGRWSGLLLVSAGLTWTWFAKSANGVALALVLVPVCVLGLLFGRVERQVRLLAVAGAVGLQTAIWFGLSRMLHYASFTDSLQDLATRHYRHPDVPDPWLNLRLLDDLLWPDYLRTQLAHPWWLVLLVLAVWGIALRSPRAALPWTAVAASGAVVLGAHPLVTEAPRFMVTLCLPIAVGLPLLVQRPRRPAWFAGRRAAAARVLQPAQPDPAEVGGPQSDPAQPDAPQSGAARSDSPQSDPRQRRQPTPATSVRPVQPDAGRSDAARPEAAEPDAARPDGAQPDGAQPDAAQPDATEPDGAQPDAAQPDGAQPGCDRPAHGRPDPALAQPAAPQPAPPKRAAPEPIAPEARRPGQRQRDAAQRKPARRVPVDREPVQGEPQQPVAAGPAEPARGKRRSKRAAGPGSSPAEDPDPVATR